jgi:spermidine/putrescine transport system substrate-binding protein
MVLSGIGLNGRSIDRAPPREEGSMTEHRRQNRLPSQLSRRTFLRRAGGVAVALPSMAAILAACDKPGTTPAGGTVAPRPLARPESPVTLPLTRDPIAADTPIEKGATLQVYNWEAYFYKKVLRDFEDAFDCKVQYTTFNNMEEGIGKLLAGQVEADVFFPTTDYVSRLVARDQLQPLNHELIPNLAANVWPVFSDPGPWYDLGAQYTVPYVIYTTGVAYRRDRVDDADVALMGYDTLFDPRFEGKVSYYNSYRDAIGMMLLRNGVGDPNSEDPAAITAAKDSILELIEDVGAVLTINGAYERLPAGVMTVAQSWSGDIVGGAISYLPPGVPSSVLGYWYPPDKKGIIGNDTIAIPTAAKSPRLAHEFLNWLLDEEQGYSNFINYNGYQPPFTSIVPDRLVADEIVPDSLSLAVVNEEMFTIGYQQGELKPEVDQLYADAWTEIRAGA